MSYIMSPSLFNQLQSVHGFANMNGKTYQEHICLIFDLTPEQKQTIMKQPTAAEALAHLGTIIDYSHSRQSLEK